MRNVTEESELDLTSGVCFVKFSATWCGPCKKMQPTISKLESEFGEVTFFEVDVDDVSTLAQLHKVKALPTVALFKDGQEINRVVGLSLIDPLRKMLRDATK